MSRETKVNYRAIHTKNPWRKARHANIENALGKKRGAEALFNGKAAIDYKKQGRPLYVIIWEDGANSGLVVKPDPEQQGQILKADIPMQSILQYESNGTARTRELEELFQSNTCEPLEVNQEDSAPVVDEYTLNSILTRRGKEAFRKRLLKAYKGKCAITGCDAEPVLEAAHIVPHSETQSYAVTNGLLLRSDIHTLFDLFFLSVNPETGIVVLAANLQQAYPEVNGAQLYMPDSLKEYPSATDLKQHYQKWQSKDNG